VREYNIADYNFKKQLDAKKKYVKHNNEVIYKEEREWTREEKIEFIDNYTNGKMTKLIEAVNKFEADENTICKSVCGGYKDNSLKAWIKRNEYDDIMNNNYRIGQINIIYGFIRYITDITTKSEYDTYADIVDEIFHRTCYELAIKERKYYYDNDPFETKKKEFKNNTYVPLICDYGYSSGGELWVEKDGNRINLTEEMIDAILIEAKKVENYANNIKANVNKFIH
jgi:hypothetical protein